MKCCNCGSENVKVEFIQTAGKTKKMGKGFIDYLLNFCRGLAALFTLGIVLLFWKKRTGNEKMSFQNEKVFICQDCGNSWKEEKETKESRIKKFFSEH